MNSADIQDNPHPKILIVGDAGTGKTRFMGSIPDVFVFDHDAGMASNRDRSVEYETIKDAPYKSRVTSKERGVHPWGTGWPHFIKRLNEIGDDIDQGKGPAAIGVDSLTTLSDICMNYVLKGDSKEAGKIQIQHWGAQIQLMQMVMDQLTAWPVTIVMSAHIQRNTNNVTEVVEMLPLLTGKLAGKVPIYFDEVWYAQVSGSGDKKSFTLQTESKGMVKQARSRFNVPTGTETDWSAVAPFFGIEP